MNVLSYYFHFPTKAELDDGGGLMGLVLLAPREANVVGLLEDEGVDVAVVLGCGLPADVGGGGHDGLLEAVAELAREGFLGDAYADAAVGGNEVGGQVHGSVEHQRGGLDDAVDELPGHVGHLAHVALQAGVAVDEADECLGVVALLDAVHFGYGLGVGGIAAYAPHGVGGIEDDAALAQHLYGVLNILFLGHREK